MTLDPYLLQKLQKMMSAKLNFFPISLIFDIFSIDVLSIMTLESDISSLHYMGVPYMKFRKTFFCKDALKMSGMKLWLLQFEDMMELYSLFDHVYSGPVLEKRNFSPKKIDVL